MKKFTILFFTILTMLHCKNKEENPENTNNQEITTEEKKLDTLAMGNYLFEDGKNLITFVIEENGNKIKGFLTYELAEKDKNSGKFSGKFENGILIGKYTFKSEGKESTREVAFKVDGDKLIEGYGELNDDGTTFKDASNLNFTSKMPLTKIDGVFE
jgi:hypothetical protein